MTSILQFVEPIVWPLLWLFDAALCVAIVLKVPYTEIDWEAYMEQVAQIRSGERDYLQISGCTGPLVYPAGHVLIYDWLYQLCDGGVDIRLAQYVFVVLYLATLAVVLSIYRKAGLKSWYAIPLVLSKRLHSVYLLRLFNDCFVTFFAVLGVRLAQSYRLTLAAVLFSAAVSIKMSALLYVPGLAMIVYSLRGWKGASVGVPMVLVQAAVAYPFRKYPKSYIKGAFNLGRQFLYKWTVNWRFVPEEVFSSPRFASSLLAIHVSVLLALARLTIRGRLSPRNIARVLTVSNLIGIACARSLHYQFYAWFYWSIPLLAADCAEMLTQVLVIPALCICIEFSWLTYPSTAISSAFSLGCMCVLILSGMQAVSRSS